MTMMSRIYSYCMESLRLSCHICLHMLARVVTRLLYRVRIDGKLDVPQGHGVLFIANHTSFIDFIMIPNIVPWRRALYAVMDYGIFQKPLLTPICKLAGSIPIISKKFNLLVREQAFHKIRERLGRGE